MKKHPIDELFSSSLKEHSSSPSQRAAELFQQRLAERKQQQEAQKRPAVFFGLPTRNYYWAAAASVLMALGISWYAWQPDDASPMAETLPVEVQSPAAVVPETSAPVIIKEIPAQKVAVIAAKNEKNKKQKMAVVPKAATNTPPRAEIPQNPVLDEPIMDELTVAVLNAEKERNTKETLKGNRKQADERKALFQSAPAETVIVITDIKPAEETLLIPELNGDSPVTVAQATEMGKNGVYAERAFLAKVLTEIRHLKHGEKLDVEGLNERSNAAFAAGNEGFIANEKQELAYRIDKIKGIFAKNN